MNEKLREAISALEAGLVGKLDAAWVPGLGQCSHGQLKTILAALRPNAGSGGADREGLCEAVQSATPGTYLTDQEARNIVDSVLGALAPLVPTAEPSPPVVGWRPTHRHVARGGEYQVIGEAQVQTVTGLCDYDVVTVYRDAEGGLWVRATSEFDDGRFVALSAAPDAISTDPQAGTQRSGVDQ
jgi:hypothetical protein